MDINKQIEEEAREYRDREYQERIIRVNSYFDSVDIEMAFKNGYKSALHSSRWRKVSEVLPEMGYRVLVRNEFKVSHLGYIDTVGDWRYCLNNELIRDKLLEWKPID